MHGPDETQTTVRLAIVGHVDHGKSTLIGRLLHDTDSLPTDVLDKARQAAADGRTPFEFITDHLAEERRQARTIDTTTIFFTHGGRQYAIIDTPGHAEFVKNTFTGASHADAALLVVDAAEGLREQTLAHCHLLALLGIGHVVPIVNKMDKVGYEQARFAELAGQVAARLQELGIEPQPAVPISARCGENIVAGSGKMAWYAGPTLLAVLAEIPPAASPEGRPMRFAVQDAYDVDGRRVYVGRVEEGVLRAGDDVLVLPQGTANKIESIEVFAATRTLATAGDCVGLTLAGPIDPPRGRILCDPRDPPATSAELSGRLIWLAEPPLAEGESLHARIATQETLGRVTGLSDCFAANDPARVQPRAASLAYGQIATVQLALEGPLVREPFAGDNPLGRFVLVRDGGVAGAGTVLR